MAAMFDLLSLQRTLYVGVSPTEGLYPCAQESTAIFWITDGHRFSTPKGLAETISIPALNRAGSEFYEEPFRWEQRLYTIALTSPGSAPLLNPSVGHMSTATGGDFWHIDSLPKLQQCIRNIMGAKKSIPNPDLASVPPSIPVAHIEGVHINLLPHPDLAPAGREPERVFLYANSGGQRNFPIPEHFLPASLLRPDGKLFFRPEGIPDIPYRKGIPEIFYSMKDDVISIPEGFPADRFRIDQTATARELLTRERRVCWTLHVKDEMSSRKNGKLTMGPPFGFLKLSGRDQFISLYIFPYNFPRLFRLVGAALKFPPTKIPEKWTKDLMNYLEELPHYYVKPVYQVFETMKLTHMWPRQANTSQSIPVFTEHIKHVYARAHLDMEKIKKDVASNAEKLVQSRLPKNKEMIPVNLFSVDASSMNSEELVKTVSRKILSASDIQQQLDGASKSGLGDVVGKGSSGAGGIGGAVNDPSHSVPISSMGDYTSAMSKRQELRDPFETDEVRMHREKTMFGNPYKRFEDPSIISSSRSSPLAKDENSDSDDDTSMDEASEEAAELGKFAEAGSLPRNDSPRLPHAKRRRESLSKLPLFRRQRVPTLSPMLSPVLVVPKFVSHASDSSGNSLSWDGLDAFYGRVDRTLQEKGLDSVKSTPIMRPINFSTPIPTANLEIPGTPLSPMMLPESVGSGRPTKHPLSDSTHSPHKKRKTEVKS